MSIVTLASLIALAGYEANTHQTLNLPKPLCRELTTAYALTPNAQIEEAVRRAVIATQDIGTNGCDDDRYTLDRSFYYEMLGNLDSSRCVEVTP